MAIEDTINSIENHLQADYKALENIGADLTGIDKNIENIAQCVNEIYDNLPKTSYGEGTNISLANTLKGKLDFDNLLYGDVEQDTLTGKNLYVGSQDFSGTWNNENLWEDVTEKYNGLVVKKKASQWGGLSKDIELEVGTYTFSLYAKSDTSRTCSFFIGGGTANIYPTSATANVTTTWTRYYITFNVTSSGTIKARLENTTDGGTTNYTYICGYQLETGSSMTDYEPYCGGIPSPNPNYPQDIQVVTGTQEVKVANKNLYFGNNKTFTVGGVTATVSNNGSKIVLNGTATSTGVNIFSNNETIIPSLLQGKNVSYSITTSDTTTNFKCWLGAFDEGGSPYNVINSGISTSNIPNGTKVENFAFPSYAYKWRSVLGVVSGVTYNNFEINIQLEIGASATTYEKYNPTSYTLHLGDLELAKIGEYADEILYDIDNDKFYKNQKIGKYQFTGNEAINLQSINSYGIANFFVTHNLNAIASLGLCNYFTIQTSGISVTQEEGFLWQQVGVYFRIKSSTASDVNSFKSWLGSHNTIVYYQLATPTLTEITNTTLIEELKDLYNMQSMSGTTNIQVEGTLAGGLKVRALKGV